MRQISWNPEKNAQLKAERNISFEDVLTAFAQDKILDSESGKIRAPIGFYY